MTTNLAAMHRAVTIISSFSRYPGEFHGKNCSHRFDGIRQQKSKVESLAKFCSTINEIAAELELAVIVKTDENTMMGIQIWRSQEALDAFEERRAKWFSNIETHVRDRNDYESDVDFLVPADKVFRRRCD